MAYGIEIFNSAGNAFLGDGEKTMLYWGKITVNHTFVSGSAPTNVSLFNIPKSKSIAVYVKSDVIGFASGKNDQAGLYWTGYVDPLANTGTYTFYVFVPVHMVTPPTWGVSIWDSNNENVFHSARPPLQIDDLLPVSNTGVTQVVKTYTYDVACLPATAQAISQAGNQTSQHYRYACEGKSIVFRLIGTSFNPQLAVYFVSTVTGIIKTSFYDQFANLGNY